MISLFGFGPLQAVVLNKALSLLVVTSSLPFRSAAVPFTNVVDRWDIVVTLASGSIIGAWLGAGWATRVKPKLLQNTLAGLLLLIAGVLLWSHMSDVQSLQMTSIATAVVGVVAGFGIGIVAAVMGVAGGELLIPAIVLLFGVDVKLAGSLSLAVSLPTMIVSFARYSLDSSFAVIKSERSFLLLMAVGSLIGAWIGGQLLGIVPSIVLIPILTAILVISAFKLWKLRSRNV